ncbi:unnamed protein product [Lactuca virosa]|uniref:Uncharacterized protein n=1 Tax=Lactuca virosa TaxID=75947 RepID=A0AAU9NA28_9ASTR|nr:unnamed protein product [Lactuca virosa]
MEGSSTNDQSTTIETTSTVASPVTTPPLIGSGGSMVLDTDEVGLEASFLNSHSKVDIVDMLRKHTYKDELEQSKRSCSLNKTPFTNGFRSGDNLVNAREQLFEKTVTPNDVGKLNRLVIPKQHAEKHFLLQSVSTSKGVLLHFEDIEMKV